MYIPAVAEEGYVAPWRLLAMRMQRVPHVHTRKKCQVFFWRIVVALGLWADPCSGRRLSVGASVDTSSIFIDVNAPRPGTVRRCILRGGDVHGTFGQTSRQRSPCVLLVFIVCLRGAYPCTINRVSHQQTWVCLLFCCWFPPDIHPCVLSHMLPSFCLWTVHWSRCSDVFLVLYLLASLFPHNTAESGGCSCF